MAEFCSGRAEALSALFERHAAGIRRYLTRLTGNAHHADDLTQATFLSVVRSRDRFIPGARFKPWLYAIATNAARDAHRRTSREQVTDDGAAPDEAVDGVNVDPGLQKQVHLALQRLPEAQREAIVMHRFEGLSFAEIAEVTGVTESAVKVRAHRGYERLRELLKEVWQS